jgi:hypothetical protein
VPIGTEEDGTVVYGFTDDRAAVNKYYAILQELELESLVTPILV